MQRLFKNLSLLLCIAWGAHGNTEGLIKLFDKNRDTLKALAAPIVLRVGLNGEKTLDVAPKSFEAFRKFLVADVETWKSQNNTITDVKTRRKQCSPIFDNALSLCWLNTVRNSGGGSLIDNRLLFESLVHMLNCGDSFVEKSSATFLTQNVFYDWLEEEQHNIEQNLATSTISEITKLELLTLCVTGTEREKLAKHTLFDKLNPGYRARLGETSSEESLLTKSDSVADSRSAARHLEQLFIAGTRRCLIAAIDFFNRDIGSQEQECVYYKSIRTNVIAGFARLHPGDSLVFDELIRQSLQADANRGIGPTLGSKYQKVDGKYTKTSVEEYLRSVTAWFGLHYNHQPVGSITKPLLFYWVDKECVKEYAKKQRDKK
jgi:hypothetical protein